MSPLTITGIETASLTLRTKRPVGLALVQLASRAAVYRDHLHAEILGDARKFGRVEAVVVPAHPRLERHRHLDRLDRGFDDRGRERRSRISAEPAQPFTTFFTGQPMLMSMIAAPRCSLSLAASATTRGSQPASCIDTGSSHGSHRDFWSDWRVSRTIASLAIISLTVSPRRSA